MIKFAGKDIKERDAISDNMDEARKRHDFTGVVFGLSIFLSIAISIIEQNLKLMAQDYMRI